MSVIAQQIPLDLSHRPAHGRADFLVAPSNKDAVAWIDRWPAWPAPALILYGPASCGKTHLAAVWKEQTGAVFVDTNELASQSANTITKRAKHLVLDHIDPWLGDREAETVLFHLYNLMKEEKRTLLLTMRAAPQHINFAVPDLASRLRAAPAATIEPPDDALLTALLVKLFSDRQLQVGQDVLSYILPRMERSFSAAHDLVTAADRLSMAEKKGISIPLIRRILLQETQLPLGT